MIACMVPQVPLHASIHELSWWAACGLPWATESHKSQYVPSHHLHHMCQPQLRGVGCCVAPGRSMAGHAAMAAAALPTAPQAAPPTSHTT